MSQNAAQLPILSGAATAEPYLPCAPGARSLYIHVPFCFHKCHYCDFYSFVDADDRQKPYTDALIRELARLARFAANEPADSPGTSPGTRPALHTLFVGGGTPTLLQPGLWRRILETLHEHFKLAPHAEFTVECNPETATPDLLRTLAEGGVNRISIGAQSFNQAHLKTLERWHDPASVPRALRLAADAGIARRSIDLIFGIPGQTLDQWREDLDSALVLDPGIEHISCYSLTYEPNTAMTRRLHAGEFTPVDPDTDAAMFSLTLKHLRDHGFERYEVSNFATPGAECRHNLAYWRQEPWLAAGPSASAHIGGARWKNVPRLTDWMRGVNATDGLSPVVELEPPDQRRALAEKIMTGLRLAEGLDATQIPDAADALSRAIAKHHRTGALTTTDNRWRLTDQGFLYADAIAAELMAAIPRRPQTK